MGNYCIKCVNKYDSDKTIAYIKIRKDGSYQLEEDGDFATSYETVEEAQKVTEYLNLIIAWEKRNYLHRVCDKRKLTPHIVYAIKLNRKNANHKNLFVAITDEDSYFGEGLCIHTTPEGAVNKPKISDAVIFAQNVSRLFPHWNLSVVEVDLNKDFRLNDDYVTVVENIFNFKLR